eukprot:8523063-Heterocapsa_arctica.AAC.1
MGNITAWVRSLAPTSPILVYTVQDDTIFTMDEMEHNYAEKTAQMQCYDALIGGCHGTKGEKQEPGYRFEVEKNNRYGWVPRGA